MSELARQRNARDIWISRGHLYAMAAGGALAVLASFALMVPAIVVGERRGMVKQVFIAAIALCLPDDLHAVHIRHFPVRGGRY